MKPILKSKHVNVITNFRLKQRTEDSNLAIIMNDVSFEEVGSTHFLGRSCRYYNMFMDICRTAGIYSLRSLAKSCFPDKWYITVCYMLNFHMEIEFGGGGMYK